MFSPKTKITDFHWSLIYTLQGINFTIDKFLREMFPTKSKIRKTKNNHCALGEIWEGTPLIINDEKSPFYTDLVFFLGWMQNLFYQIALYGIHWIFLALCMYLRTFFLIHQWFFRSSLWQSKSLVTQRFHTPHRALIWKNESHWVAVAALKLHSKESFLALHDNKMTITLYVGVSPLEWLQVYICVYIRKYRF